ncbi:hypothetical protein F441_03278 [Phytophthora nicotianae CJ01A1]|uniref:Uncharacterized protein n=2 Tax=Phytophthora nicotianae TaxID=4792 RepID=W2XLT2_PHYNI|nr:hypothetical protein F444_03359 [Phytophthora nicotianae P1976]ETP23621.1 hypothetical protein F441_03278 [Phytophthora nicotianae CJ01A1]
MMPLSVDRFCARTESVTDDFVPSCTVSATAPAEEERQ